jgi:hypothetical protein
MYLRRVAATLIACASFQGSGCATVPPRDFATMSLDELRQARREPMPACAQPFTVCKGKVCALSSTLGPEQASAWMQCKPAVERWEHDQLETRNAILERDPLPSCFDPGKQAYRDAGVSPYSPERNLLMLAKGENLGSVPCTLAHCAWVARNADDVEQLTAVCAKLPQPSTSATGSHP